MLDKLLIRAGNVLLGCALVALAPSPAHAQEPSAPGGEADGVQPASGTLSVGLSGTAALKGVPNLSISPDGVDFGLVDIGAPAVITVTLTHDGAPGSDPIAFGETRLFGKDEEAFSSGFGGFVSLDPGQSQTVPVSFAPLLPGPKSAGLQLMVEGDVAPMVILFEGSARYPLVAEIQSDATALAFGQIVTGGQASRSVTLSNIGDADAPDLLVSTAQLGGPFAGSFQVAFEPLSIAPGQSAQVQVVFDDAAPGNKTATLQLYHDGNNETVEIALQGEVVEPAAVPVGFAWSAVPANVQRGTAIDFGPDGRLYVAQMNGSIKVFEASRNGKNDYDVDLVETIDLVKNVPNHDDDGTPNGSIKDRLVTGILVVGSAQAPVIWVGSSDPRQGAGKSGEDKNLDTNSGSIHKLVRNGGGWQKQDVVRGLPRSEENHAVNGMTFKDGKLIVMIGGFTNKGVPSNNFAEISEYALSAAALEIDVDAIGGATYDLPTLDDEDRAGTDDANDPFGGNDGKNQAKLVDGGPVQLYAAGFRNAYDIVLTRSGKLYTFDNGPNVKWGGPPDGACDNGIDNGGTTENDQLHLVQKGGYYGHPNPVRADKGNTFNADGQSPVEIAADPRQCEYRKQPDDGSLLVFGASTNGITEYTAGNFAGSMNGDLVVVSYGKTATRIELDGAGTKVTSSKVIANFGSDPSSHVPLDVTAQGEGEVFAGTIWVVDNISKSLYVLEPNDY